MVERASKKQKTKKLVKRMFTEYSRSHTLIEMFALMVDSCDKCDSSQMKGLVVATVWEVWLNGFNKNFTAFLCATSVLLLQPYGMRAITAKKCLKTGIRRKSDVYVCNFQNNGPKLPLLSHYHPPPRTLLQSLHFSEKKGHKKHQHKYWTILCSLRLIRFHFYLLFFCFWFLF